MNLEGQRDTHFRSEHLRNDVRVREEEMRPFLERAGMPADVRIERLVSRATNEVYTLTTSEGQQYVLRIGRHSGWNRFREERWALDQCLQAGISVVPKVLAVDTIQHDGEPYVACLEEKLPGASLDELQVPEERRQELLRKAGEILASIHMVKVNGFDSFDTDGKGRYGSVQAVFADPYIGKEKMMQIGREQQCGQILQDALDIIEREVPRFPDMQPRLVHNDLEPKHFLIEGDRISGVLDFEMAVGGDPVLDFARWHYFRKNEGDLDFLMEGYTNQNVRAQRDFDIRFNVWRIYIGLGNLAYQHQEHNHAGVEFAKGEIAADVAYYHEHLSKR